MEPVNVTLDAQETSLVEMKKRNVNEEMSPEHLDQVQAALFTLGVRSISLQFHLKPQ